MPSNTMVPARHDYIYGLDLVRFISAFIVAYFHLAFSVWARPGSGGAVVVEAPLAFPDLASTAWVGWVGVEVFFVLSGLVIANSANGASPWSFARSRILRLYPAVWLCAPVTLAVLFASNAYGIAEIVNRFIRSITLFPIYPWVDPVYWTLAVEIVFYGLVALVIFIGRFELIVKVLLGVSVACLFYQGLVFAGRSGLMAIPELGLQASRLTLLSHGSFFALGVFFWATNRARNGAFLPHIAVSGLACCLEVLNHTTFVIEIMSAYPVGSGSAFLGPLFVWLTLTLGVFLFSRHPRCLDFIGDAGKNVVRILGAMTFPLYLIHFNIGVFLMDALERHLFSREWSLVITLCLLVAASFLACRYAEPRIRRLLASHLDRLSVHSWSGWLGSRINSPSQPLYR